MNARILIVDDEANICSVIADYLEDDGFQVLTAQTIATARQLFSIESLPDLILLDVMLKDGSGMIFLREVRMNPVTKDIPVIMISAHRSKGEHRALGLEMGADDYMAKPFDLKELKLRIVNILKRSSVRPAAPPPSATVPPASPMVPPAAPPPVVVPKRLAPPPSVVEVPSAPVRRGLWLQVWDLLIDPISFIQTWEPAAARRFSWFLVGITALALGLQRGFQNGSGGAALASIVIYVGAFSAALGGSAWCIQWYRGLKQKPVSWVSLFSALSLGLAPLAVAACLGLIYVVGASGRTGDFTAGLLLAFPMQGGSDTWGYALRRIDIFEFWMVALAGAGLAKALNANVRRTLIWTAAGWGGVVVVTGAILRMF